MSDYAITKDWPDTISFDRLHALSARGYRPRLGMATDDSGFARIDLAHPRVRGKLVPPKLTLWSNGILATSELLWPARHVVQDDGTAPDWQKFIEASDDKLFRSFVDSVPAPNALDLYGFPFVGFLRVSAARFLYASMLCLCIAVAIRVLTHSVGA